MLHHHAVVLAVAKQGMEEVVEVAGRAQIVTLEMATPMGSLRDMVVVVVGVAIGFWRGNARRVSHLVVATW